MREIVFDAANGEHKIYASVWEPDTAAAGVFQISHGMNEYAQRYGEFAEYLAGKGFAVCANDHAGHGKSFNKMRGYFGKADGWRHMVDDMKKLYDLTSAEYAGLPYFMLGHSMGSYLTRAYCAIYGNTLSGAIFSGTSDAPAMLPLAILLDRIIVRMGGAESEGRVFQQLTSGSYNKRFKPNRSGSDWLTRDNEKIDAFLNDSRSQFKFTNSAYGDLFAALSFISRKSWAESLPRQLPILLFSGGEDPLSVGGKGVFTVFKRMTAAGCTDVMMKLYGQGRHEMLNELNRAEVYADIYNWMSVRMAVRNSV